MSSVYIHEPPTRGKVLLKTTAGDIDIELWSKEAPLACRNFVQLCMEGYYNKTIFHRLVKGFIIQGGDPTGTGMGGESIYGNNFKDEFHSRLKFSRRGLVAMANAGQKDDNGSQFFITLDATPELQNVHTIFGKVGGKTIFNVLALTEGEVDQNDRPKNPHKIISTEILNNPFDDIVPREKMEKAPKRSKEDKARLNVKASKNFALLSFGDEAEEEEEEIEKVVTNFKTKSKSSHDLLKDDDTLSSVPAIDNDEMELVPGDIMSQPSTSNSHKNFNDNNSESRLNSIKAKLHSSRPAAAESKAPKKYREEKHKNDNDDKNDNKEEEEEEEVMNIFEEERNEKKKAKIDSAKEEYNKIKAELRKNKREREANSKNNNSDNDTDTKQSSSNDPLEDYKKELFQYKKRSKKSDKSNKSGTSSCWEAIQKFKQRLDSLKTQKSNNDDTKNDDDDDDNGGGGGGKARNKSKLDSLLSHKMICTGEDEIVLARDANIRNDDGWYDIYDPRNPINKPNKKSNE